MPHNRDRTLHFSRATRARAGREKLGVGSRLCGAPGDGLIGAMRIPALTLLLLAAIAAPAQADTFAVDRGDDPATDGACTAAPDDCSLRHAIVKANNKETADTITLPALRMVLDEALPGTEGRLTIAGAGARASIVDGAGNVEQVLITNGEATVRDVTVTGALAEPASEPGAVRNVGILRLERVAIVDNRSTGLGTGGGSETTVVGSLIARNTGQGSGGIDNVSFLHVLSSTVTGNTAAPQGLSSFAVGGGVASIGFATVEHSTIARNRLAPGVAIVKAANLAIFTSPVLDHGAVVRSSIIDDDGGVGGNCAGRIGSGGGNVVSDGTCGLALAGDRVADPRLASLADNGGPTDTHALLDDSPAIGAAADCGNADQRGVVRLQAVCDSGAFESALDRPVVAPKPVAARRDATRPRLRVRGVPKTVTRRALNAGLKVRVSADEPIAAEVSLLVTSPRRVLAVRSLVFAAGARTVTLKPKRRRRLTGSRAITARVRVIAADGSANKSSKTLRLRVR